MASSHDFPFISPVSFEVGKNCRQRELMHPRISALCLCDVGFDGYTVKRNRRLISRFFPSERVNCSSVIRLQFRGAATAFEPRRMCKTDEARAARPQERNSDERARGRSTKQPPSGGLSRGQGVTRNALEFRFLCDNCCSIDLILANIFFVLEFSTPCCVPHPYQGIPVPFLQERVWYILL